ncbi:hypothetical protein CSKR_111715 [Clonorchis sinensis]|uniref:Uncharacterized protein n=1 Tax=Clonorchis sinensis TaxID=79923 RepID=A0A3R7FKU3_CLOSI|nr:hypothetical protein CSKR_111715 [Clonorchis sinensis]
MSCKFFKQVQTETYGFQPSLTLHFIENRLQPANACYTAKAPTIIRLNRSDVPRPDKISFTTTEQDRSYGCLLHKALYLPRNSVLTPQMTEVRKYCSRLVRRDLTSPVMAVTVYVTTQIGNAKIPSSFLHAGVPRISALCSIVVIHGQKLHTCACKYCTQWLEREVTDRKVRGSNPISNSRLPLSRLGQPGSIQAPLLPSGGMAVRHRKVATTDEILY